jgi:adenosine deaminase
MEALADLHRHLDGSLRASTLRELAARAGREVPPDLAFSPGMGLGAALARFEFTLSFLQRPREVERVAAEMCEDAAIEGVTTLEIRFAPQLHRGAPIEAIVDAALAGIAGRAGLVLCGLYGEPLEVLLRLVRVGAARRGVVGIDLAGGPSPSDGFSLAGYAPAFERAKDAGLGRTVHAGEGRSPREIVVAIEELSAERIGHATTLLDDPRALELVLEKGIVIESCPTSNVHTGAVRSLEEHPLPRWLALGVRACVCADNTLLSAVDSALEHGRARTMPGMTDELLARAIATGHEARFSKRTRAAHSGARA